MPDQTVVPSFSRRSKEYSEGSVLRTALIALIFLILFDNSGENLRQRRFLGIAECSSDADSALAGCDREPAKGPCPPWRDGPDRPEKPRLPSAMAEPSLSAPEDRDFPDDRFRADVQGLFRE